MAKENHDGSPPGKATMFYLEPLKLYQKEKPYISLVPFLNEGARQLNVKLAPYEVPVRNVRGQESDFTLDRDGFQFIKHSFKLKPSGNSVAPDHPYLVDVVSMLKGLLHAELVIPYDCVIRKAAGPSTSSCGFSDCKCTVCGTPDSTSSTCGCDQDETVYSSTCSVCKCPCGSEQHPSTAVHNDSTPDDAYRRLQILLGQDGGTSSIPKRWQIINVWCPLTGPVLDWPLALCRYGSIKPEDLVAVDTILPHCIGETYYLYHNENHQWVYLDSQEENEVVVFKTFDSDNSVANYCPHSAFKSTDPRATSKDVIPRQSVEVRAIVTYPD